MAYSKEKQAQYSREIWYPAHKAEVIARSKQNTIKYRQALRDYVQNVKSNPCVDCKIVYPPCVMDFDHVKGTKSFSVSRAANAVVKLDLIKEEIAKCELVCANCHRIRTQNRRKKS